MKSFKMYSKGMKVGGLLSFITYALFFQYHFLASNLLGIPNITWLPLLLLFFSVLTFYIQWIFKKRSSIVLKIGIAFLNIILIIFLFKLGFLIWKNQQGNILEQATEFKLSLSNIWFWVVFQSIIFILGINALKQLVTIDQK